MSIIKLTKDLVNFQWTNYDNIGDNTSQISGRHGGTLPGGQPPHPSDHSELDDGAGVPQSFYDGHSKVVTGKKEFERPNRGTLADMESRFGPLNTQPSDRGPYGVTDNMDGTKQGRGFTPPGGHPEGFTVDMGESKYVIGNPLEMTLTPLSYTVAGITSNGPHGTVPEHSIDVQFGTTWSTPAVLDAWAENFMVPPLSQYVSQHSIEQNDPPITRTFNVSDAYPNNSREYSVNSQFGWSWPEGSEYLGIHGTPWRGFKLTETVGNQIDTAGLDNVVPEWYPSPPTQVSHPVNHIYLNSEPSPAPSYLQAQFLVNYGDTDGVWPYKVLDYDTGPHPLIRRDIGQRWDINGVSSWMALQVMRTGDDITRIEKWLETSAGQNWRIKQHMLQELNPRPEVRSWSHASLIGSLVPLVHMDRHGTLSEGRDYMHYDPLMSGDKRKYGFGVRFGDDAEQNHEMKTGGAYEGRLWRLTDQFVFGSAAGDNSIAGSIAGAIVGAIQSGLASLRYGGPTDTPTQVVFSQKGPFAESRKETLSGGLPLPGSGWWGEKNKYGLFALSKLVDFQSGNDPYGFVQIGPVAAQFWGTHYNEYAPTRAWNEDGTPETLELGTINYKYQNVFKGNWYSDRVVKSSSDTPAGSPDLIHKRYKTKSYDELGGKYIPSASPIPGEGASAGDEPIAPRPFTVETAPVVQKMYDEAVKDYKTKLEVYEKDKSDIAAQDLIIENYKETLMGYGQISTNIGDPGKQQGLKRILDPNTDAGAGLGVIKTNKDDDKYKSIATDKINIHPYGEDLPADVSDFIKFKFYDIYNNKFIIFRAILSGITDSISPEWNGIQYIGRPDKVYVYQGAERKVSFSFEIYPKTKQEFPVLLEKMNYLVGLCYPSFTKDNRMVAPFIELTLGDMFNRTPGFLDSLSVDVDDTSTWEMQEGLQFPKHITCGCSFTYVGKYLPSSLGKHYELGWLEDKGWTSKGQNATMGTFQLKDSGKIQQNHVPPRTGAQLPHMKKLFDDLGAENA